ncbi:hypothetical protein HU200_042675 [Digitaria exilis]|uniref:non-specific serine/threonine protein kinase n=1 Tax=Digitaria exilis TaxID=1010633 RepID=A0A835B4K6_9POAL|nr:hypothetical protein HU200_042675 [Digitaria exilis]
MHPDRSWSCLCLPPFRFSNLHLTDLPIAVPVISSSPDSSVGHPEAILMPPPPPPPPQVVVATAHPGPPRFYLKTDGTRVARLHLLDWVVLVVLVAVDVALNAIEPFHRFVGEDMVPDLRYPLKNNTVPVWAVPVRSCVFIHKLCVRNPLVRPGLVVAVVMPMAIVAGIYVRRRNVYDLHHAILGKTPSAVRAPISSGAAFPMECRYDNVTTEVICHGDPAVIKEGYKSFPRAFAGLGFLSWYLAGKIKAFDRGGHVAKLCIVAMPLLLAAMVAVSRVDDYWHHWQDVFTAGVLGTCVLPSRSVRCYSAPAGLVVASFCYLQFFPPPSVANRHWHLTPLSDVLEWRGEPTEDTGDRDEPATIHIAGNEPQGLSSLHDSFTDLALKTTVNTNPNGVVRVLAASGTSLTGSPTQQLSMDVPLLLDPTSPPTFLLIESFPWRRVETGATHFLPRRVSATTPLPWPASSQPAQKLVRGHRQQHTARSLGTKPLAAFMASALCPAPPPPFLAVPLLVVLLLQQAHLLPLAAMAQATNLTAGATMSPPGYITSPSGTFRFGFRSLNSDPTQFLLATWFGSGSGDDGDSQSVVWFAKQSPPSGPTPNATAQSVLIVTADGKLALADGNSNQVLWAPPASTERGSVLVLRDTGNLQFLGDDSGDNNQVVVVWESFAYPTDTLLPGQSLAYDDTATSRGKVFAKRGDGEFTTGRFSMGVQSDGNVVLYVDLLYGNNPENAYWQAYTNSFDGNTTVTFDAQGRLNYTLHNGTTGSFIKPAASFAAGDYLQFARMDPDGIVRTYVRSKTKRGGNNGNNTWSSSWAVSGAYPDYGCINKRTSGLSGHVWPRTTGSSTERINCVCPDGYVYTDKQHRDTGCTPSFEPQSCDDDGGSSSSSDEFALEELINTTWEASIGYKKLPSVTEEQCRDYCLGDCSCAAALMVGGSDCVVMAMLTDGWRADDVTTKALVKASRARHAALAYKVVAICLAFLLLFTVGGGLVAYKVITRNRERQRLPGWKELYQATNGFDKKQLLGKGSFGEVYQGTIRSPQPHLIAVKKLVDSNEYSEQEFANEVRSIGQIHHRSLVRMIGYCKQGKHRMLVFEFMPGGSLRSFLFIAQKRRPPWRWRAEAALAISRGIEYLHDGCSAPIIHCDIKPDNILLDEHGVPRITDFGISKLLGNHQVHTTVTHVRGTRGYIAPEWFRGDARVDTKADVYSFGVVLLEMVCCRRCQELLTPDGMPCGGGGDDETLVGARRTEVMVDGDLDVDTVEDMERVERFARPNPLARPTMHLLVQTLETSRRTQLEAPPDPADCYLESSPLIPQLRI